MSETSTLISCTGKITRAELAMLPTPPSTATHLPIPHAAVVEALVDTLSHRQISVVEEEFAVSKDGREMFGVLDLATSFEGCRFAIGIRNANNKRLRLACTVGLRVFVCHNLAFRGLPRQCDINGVVSLMFFISLCVMCEYSDFPAQLGHSLPACS